MSYPVYYPVAGDILPHLFSTYGGTNGESVTMTGFAVTDIEIYKDGSTTQRASDSGVTLLDTDGTDFDGITGIHGFQIDLSDNTDASFYSTGSWFHVVVSAVTVDTQTVSFVACAFRIVSATRGLAGTALPDAAADAAGGLPISDAGGLDLDGLNTNVSSILADTGTDGVVVASGSKTGYSISGTLTTLDALDTAQDSQHTTTRALIGTPSDLGGGATLAANNTDMAGATFSTATDSQEAIRDRGDAAWTTGSGTGLTALATGTAQAGAAGTITLAAGASATNDLYNGQVVKLTSGTGAGQARIVTAYVGSTRVATVTPNWTTNPDATSVYEIVEGPADVRLVSGAAEDLPTATALATAQADLDTLTGTDGATLATSQPNYAPATATALSTAQADLDTITGSDGVTLATAQANYAPSKAGDAMALTSGERTTLAGVIWDSLTSGMVTVGSIGKKLADWTIHSAADVWSVATRVLTANTNLNDPTAAAIADAVWDEAQSGHTTAGTFGKYLDTEVSGVGGGSLTEAGIADAVWEEALADHSGTAGSTAEALSNVSAPGSKIDIDGLVDKSGPNYLWIANLRVNGSVVNSGLSNLTVVGAYGNNGETDLSYSAVSGPTIGTNHSMYGSFTLGTTPTTGTPWYLEITVDYGGTTYRGRLQVVVQA